MTMQKRVALMNSAGLQSLVVARGELPISIIDTKLPLRYHNKLYYYMRHSFDGVVLYQEMPEPINVDDIFEESI